MSIKRNILLTPGPTTTTDSVKYAQVVPDICPREEEFGAVIKRVQSDLVRIAQGNEGYTTVLFSGSGTSVMDACINSIVPPKQKIAIVNNGAYGERMVNIAKAYNIPYIEINFEWDEAPDPDQVRLILEKNRNVSCLAAVHHETTTGQLNPIGELGAIAKDNGCVFLVDAISSFAGIPFDIKSYGIDFMLSTSNKCIQGLPGVAFVICRKASLEDIKEYPPRSFYLNLYQQYAFLEKTGQMQFTPPVQTIYALRCAIDEYFDEGGENRYGRYVRNWQIVSKGLKELGFRLLLKDSQQSHLLTTVLEPEDPNYNFHKMHDMLYERGFTIYPGKMGGANTFRIANIGDIEEHDINKFLKVMETVLNKMNVRLR